MISIILRTSSKSDVGSLYLYMKNRKLGLNKYIALGLKIRSNSWNTSAQLPKDTAGMEPVKELDDMSYMNLTTKLLKLKSILKPMEEDGTILNTVTDDNGSSVDIVKYTINQVLNAEHIADVKAKEEEDRKRKENARMEEESRNRMTLNKFIDNYIQECESGKRLKKKSSRNIAFSTIKGYKGFQSQFNEYQKKRHKVIDFDDVTMDFYKDFKRFFIEKEYSPNTIARHVRILKIMLYAAKDMKYINNLDFTNSGFSADWEDVDNVYLTEERVQQMYEFDLSENETLSDARDIFIVGCLTGQRVSDYKRINSRMIVKLRDGKDYIHLTQQKTHKEIYVPLDIRVKNILDRHNGTLPKIYDQHLNQRIKEVGERLGWTEIADISEHKGTLTYKSDKRFCDCIKTHTARRTYATVAYQNNVPLAAIMAVTGHSSETMLKKYLKLDSKERAMLAAQEMEKVTKIMEAL
jgi:integrase